MKRWSLNGLRLKLLWELTCYLPGAASLIRVKARKLPLTYTTYVRPILVISESCERWGSTNGQFGDFRGFLTETLTDDWGYQMRPFKLMRLGQIGDSHGHRSQHRPLTHENRSAMQLLSFVGSTGISDDDSDISAHAIRTLNYQPQHTHSPEKYLHNNSITLVASSWHGILHWRDTSDMQLQLLLSTMYYNRIVKNTMQYQGTYIC